LALITGAKNKAELGRALDMKLKAIWAAMDRGGVPYPQIVDKIQPGEWEYVFTGRRTPRALPLAEAIKAVEAAGLAVVSRSAIQAAPAAPRPQGEGSPS
jgi:hypothetical protein